MRGLHYPICWLINGYQWLISPVLGPHCRHLPTCSEFALEAFERHGLWLGTALSIGRLLRCHPWGTSGYDPVPEVRDLREKSKARASSRSIE